ncbi:radical SAM protein [Candidatus Saccharibacteria bacterium]|nr:radical SAM protein [Candidatus Saccharibacteria bacterium]MBQ6127161.1 radical SAM protein [Candidatus Saccharibacteria bacterium]
MDAKLWKYKPNSINIETVQGCNRRCDFCGTMGMEKKLHFLEIETLEHTLDLIKKSHLSPKIRLASHGEPTLHKNIVKIVKKIREALPKSPIALFTNGTVIEKKPELVAELFDAGLNNLIVDEYSDHRVGTFVRNNEICKAFKIVEQGKGVPLLEVTEKDRRICITPPIDGEKNTVNRTLCNQLGAAMPPLKTPLVGKKCTVIFRELTIRHDGNIAICCNDFRGYYYVTNILKCSKLEDAWFHPRFEAARRFLYIGDRGFFPCNLCDVLGNRVGLLPDAQGKTEMPEPTERDREIVDIVYPPLAIIEKRRWEGGEI